MHEREPLEGEYEPPQPEPAQPRKQRRAGALGATAATIAALALKFKFLLVGLKFFALSWTFILSLLLYVAFFGWRIGIVLVLVIAAHELGHYFAYRAYGLPVRAPVFVPFLGAYTAGALAPDLESDAYIALAGPVTGLVLAGCCYAVGLANDDRFWFASADICAFLNLFNMLPVPPFDGGRVIGAVWPPLWIAGALAFVAAAVFLHVPIIFVLLIALLGFPVMIAALRGKPDPRAAAMTNAARARVGLWYLATVLGLLYVLGQAHAALPSTALPSTALPSTAPPSTGTL
ncbi:MAG TPA: site-2 protease family protein [Candidatus Baltobacteraceae bacterium]|nr:site-2 protease family protein [Candidatus Baltobacteraceae bacterium]